MKVKVKACLQECRAQEVRAAFCVQKLMCYVLIRMQSFP